MPLSENLLIKSWRRQKPQHSPLDNARNFDVATKSHQNFCFLDGDGESRHPLVVLQGIIAYPVCCLRVFSSVTKSRLRCRSTRTLQIWNPPIVLSLPILQSCPSLPWRVQEGRCWPKGHEEHKGSCSEDTYMEEEKVEVKVQEDEVEDGTDKRRVRRGSRREIKLTTKRMTHGWDDAHKHLSNLYQKWQHRDTAAVPPTHRHKQKNDRGCKMVQRCTIMTILVFTFQPACLCPTNCATNDDRQMGMTDKETPQWCAGGDLPA